MSNLILNIRFGAYHLQLTRMSDWRYRWPLTISHNPVHADPAYRARQGDWRWFENYEGGRWLLAGIVALVAGIVNIV